MAYFIGVDEAGYGPNLGPLVISATVWQTKANHIDFDFYEALSEVVSTTANKKSAPTRVMIADSKQVYASGKGLGALERVILASLRLIGRECHDLNQLWNCLSPATQKQREFLPWHQETAEKLPIDADDSQIDATFQLLKDGFSPEGIELLNVQSTTIFPQQFNQMVQQYGNKGAALSHQSIQLVAQMLHGLETQPTLIICDKHGGRNRYGELLQHYFPDPLIEVYEEGRQRSIYRWGKNPDRKEIRFQVGGESFLPTALASMTSKYLREIAMRSFNQFWCQHLPNLRPTAGYPVDAKRFKAEIDSTQKKMKIDDEILWRCR